jgi:hypothetical protein
MIFCEYNFDSFETVVTQSDAQQDCFVTSKYHNVAICVSLLEYSTV